MELSGEFPVKLLCEMMNIRRSSFYAWKKKLSRPSERTKNLVSNIRLFQEYHLRFPSHGYRWLNAKLRLDTGLVLSDPYAHKCCKIAGIKSKAKHYQYKKPGDPGRVFPNLLLSEIQIDGPLQCIVSDMTAFYVKGVYYELTLYMDLWNNEIVSHSLSSKRGDRMTYISGLQDLIALKQQYPQYEMILHSDKAPFMRLKRLMICCPCTALRIPCPEQAHPPTMLLWKQSMVGSRRSCLWIFMSRVRNRWKPKLMSISISSTNSARRTR